MEARLNEKLKSPDFSVVSYLNLALDDNSSDWQARMTQVALQLQLQTQSCHEEIGRLGAELQAIVPRCAADVGRLGVGLQGLSADATELLEQARMAPNDTIATLGQLHSLQSHLTSARSVLRAASQWDTTLASLAPLLAQTNVAGAVDALQDLEEGFQALSGMPGHGERAESLQQLQSQVSALLEPQLRAALAQMPGNRKALEEMVQLYAKLDQSEELISHYIGQTRRAAASVRQVWFSYNNQDDLTEWWPQYWNHVQTVLDDERLEAEAIFGSHLVPRIVRECLVHITEPLQPSFTTRLMTLCALPTVADAVPSDGPPMAKASNWPAIVQAYKCWLEFGSNLQNTLVAHWSNEDDDVARREWEALLGVLEQLREPFDQHISHAIELERAYLESTLRLDGFANNLDDLDVTVVQESSQMIWTSLRQAWERLRWIGMDVQVFAEMANDVLIQFCRDWTMKLQQLVAREDSLDEAHVHTALCLLESVGRWDMDMDSWETFMLESIPARGIFHATESLSPPLLAQQFQEPSPAGLAEAPMSRARQTVHEKLGPAATNVVFDVCWAVPRKYLQDLAGLEAWADKSPPADAYGILPQSYMNHVGEHMVALVQALEPFQDDNARTACQRVLQPIGRQPWRDLVQASGVTLSDPIIQTLQDGKELEALTVEQAVYEEYDVDDNSAAREFGNWWLNSVASAVTGRLLERILRIPSLTSRGAQQLQTDLAYLANVLSALGVDGHPHILITHWENLVTDPAMLEQTMASRDTRQSVQVCLKAMEERLAAMISS